MLTSRDKSLLQATIDIARTSSHTQYLFGSIIIKNGDILSVSTNSQKSHPLQMRYNPLRKMVGNYNNHHLHSEIASLVKVKNKNILRGSAIYVGRIGKDNKVKMARPCAACVQALKDHGIRDIYFTTADGYGYERLSNH